MNTVLTNIITQSSNTGLFFFYIFVHSLNLKIIALHTTEQTAVTFLIPFQPSLSLRTMSKLVAHYALMLLSNDSYHLDLALRGGMHQNPLGFLKQIAAPPLAFLTHSGLAEA